MKFQIISTLSWLVQISSAIESKGAKSTKAPKVPKSPKFTKAPKGTEATTGPSSQPSFNASPSTTGPSSQPSLIASPSVEAYISNLDPSKFNEAGFSICFDLTNGFTIAQDSASLVITNDGDSISVTAFEYNTLLGQLCTEPGVVTTDGKMDLELRADTTSGEGIELLTSVVAGSSTVTVNLLADNGDVFTGIARVSAQSADIGSVQAVADMTDGSGYVVLTNIPSRTLIVNAKGGGNEVGFAGVVPSSPGSSSSIDVFMTTFKAPSDIANNNFSQGTVGWLLPNDLIGAGGLEKVSIVAHEEDVGPGKSGRRRHRHRRAQSSLNDYDLMVNTAGVEGQTSVSRTFNVGDGVTGEGTIPLSDK